MKDNIIKFHGFEKDIRGSMWEHIDGIEYKPSFIDVIQSYEGEARDKEFLAFVGCALMTGDAQKDMDMLAEFLKTVQERTPSVWQYIDEEMYMVDYALDTHMLQLLMLLHEVVLTTQTIKASVKYSLQYNGNATTFFEKVFSGYATKTNIGLFLFLMIQKEPAGLGLWQDKWVSLIRISVTPQLANIAHELGIASNGLRCTAAFIDEIQ